MRFLIAAVAVAAGVSVGCSSEDASDRTPTYAEDVAPLMIKSCEGCHREGGIGPFALSTYEQVKRYSALVAEKVESRAMPPWGAYETESCKPRFKWKHDLRLSEQEIATVLKWARNGTPSGDLNKLPAKPSFADVKLAGATDALSFPPYTVKASGADDIRCFPVDAKLPPDTWIEGTNVVPGDPRVVHHVIVYTDPKRQSIARAGDAGSYECFGGPEVEDSGILVAWAPGQQAMDYAPHAALQPPNDGMLVVQVHYHPSGTETTDATKIELRRRTDKPPYKAVVALVGNAATPAGGLLPGPNDPTTGPAFTIPAGAKGHVESMTFTVPPTPNLFLHSVLAHMHWVGRDMKIELKRSIAAAGDPTEECLLGAPKYDFNWQRFYSYDAPVDELPMIRAGDELKLTCTYDNTMDNPNVVKALQDQKLSSPVEIKLGEETLEEMCIGAFVVLQKI